jgi:hypothetical protein
MLVTGFKTDLWLVKMVGLLSLTIGISLFQSFLYRNFPISIFLVAGGAAISFAWIDFYYVGTQSIPAIYLIDGALQIIFIVFYILFYIRSKNFQ